MRRENGVFRLEEYTREVHFKKRTIKGIKTKEIPNQIKSKKLFATFGDGELGMGVSFGILGGCSVLVMFIKFNVLRKLSEHFKRYLRIQSISDPV